VVQAICTKKSQAPKRSWLSNISWILYVYGVAICSHIGSVPIGCCRYSATKDNEQEWKHARHKKQHKSQSNITRQSTNHGAKPYETAETDVDSLNQCICFGTRE